MNIAIISLKKHQYLGGTETYVSFLIPALMKLGHKITEFYIDDTETDLVREPYKVEQISLHTKGPYETKLNRFLNRVNDSTFDYVINNTLYTNKKAMKSLKHILIQHRNYDTYNFNFYSLSDRIKLRLDNIFLGQGFCGNIMRKSSRSVYFCEESNPENNSNVVGYIQNPAIVNTSNIARDQGIVWVGRIAYEEKNLVDLDRVINSLESVTVAKSAIFGSGPDIDKLSEKSKGMLKGYISSDVVPIELAKKRVFILTSIKEGFPFIVSEALAAGCAVVMYNTFDSSIFFDKCSSVYVFNKADTYLMIDKINNLMSLTDVEFENISSSSRAFHNEFLSIEAFEKGWKKIMQ